MFAVYGCKCAPGAILDSADISLFLRHVILALDDVGEEILGLGPQLFKLPIHIKLNDSETTSCGNPMDVPDAPHECVYITIIVVICGSK